MNRSSVLNRNFTRRKHAR